MIPIKKTLILFTFCACAVFCFTPASADSTVIKSYSFDKKKASKDWSARKTFMVGENRRLGLFNNRNKRYPSQTILTLNELPAATNLELQFDMVFVGSWDSEGKLADKFVVSILDGPELFSMTEFPCTLIDNDDSRPLNNDGLVLVGAKDRAYWTEKIRISIPVNEIKKGSISIKFEGFLTGRKTEFWALDNVEIITK